MLVYRGLEADTMNIYGVRNDGTWARFHGGCLLNGKPIKGLYINNGKKIVTRRQ